MSLNRVSYKLLSITRSNIKTTFGRRAILNDVPVRQDSTYKAVVLEEANKPLKIEEVKAPKKLKKGQVRIKVHSCAVNALDYLLIQGINPGNFKLPITPGYEFSGTVLECKDCENFGKGDKVVALNKDALGGLAEQCIVDEKDVWPIPPSLSLLKASALVDSFGTALLGLSRHSHILQKQIVVTTLAPTHGYAPLELAANVYKTKVIAVVMTESETENVRERGAWSALAYSEKQLISTVRELTQNNGANVIYDTLAGDVLKTCLSCVAHEGHILVAGYTLRELPQVQMSQLLSLPSFYISGVSLKSYRKHAIDTYRQTISDVLEMSEQNLIRPEVAQTFALKDINKALELIKEKQPIGKIIVEIDK